MTLPTDLPTPLPTFQFDDPIIVVDVESTGLDIRTDYPVEVAWYNLATGERAQFVPGHDLDEALHGGHPRALAVNHYRDRILPLIFSGHMDSHGDEAWKLWEQLTAGPGRPYLAGVNAAGHDQWMIAKLWPALNWTSDFPWRYRILDIGNLALAELDIDYIPSLSATVDLLGLEIPKPDHSAMGDVYTTTLVLVELLRRKDARLGIERDENGNRLCGAPVMSASETGIVGPCVLPAHGADPNTTNPACCATLQV